MTGISDRVNAWLNDDRILAHPNNEQRLHGEEKP